MTFTECLFYCIGEPELVKEFNRLTGSRIGVDDRKPIERLVDEAAGYIPFADDYVKFIQFVWAAIYLPLKEAERGRGPGLFS